MNHALVHGTRGAAMPARTRSMLEAPIVPTLRRLAAPNVLNLLAIAGMITFDGLFAGRLGADALAGLSLAFPWVMLMQHAAASGMGGAVSSAIARSLGAGQQERADALATHAFFLALGLAALSLIVMLAAGSALYRGMGGAGRVLDTIAAAFLVYAVLTSVAFLRISAPRRKEDDATRSAS